jgi:diaminohydroxyphosphoribosylaminopyrimidine deaminase/5-amino-6-(5-phosphoribosylamino)uracil reductase
MNDVPAAESTSDIPQDVPPAVPPRAMTPEEDDRFMRLALALGRRNLGRTWPNPAVGAVVVRDGLVVGRGWTQPGGRPHAETQALKRAGKLAEGATMYVSLEPCSHKGKTPPCADAIIRAGVARVVSAMQDPNPEVAGSGYAKLTGKGIQVDTGLGAIDAQRIHAGHVRRITDGRPHVVLKMAVSADDKVGAAGRRPVAITGEASRERVFQMRAHNDAIMVGIGTILSDNPALTVRLPGMFEQSPVRVVLDSQLRVPLASHVVATVRETPTWVFGSGAASPIAEEILTERGAKVFRVDSKDGRLDLTEVLKRLADEGITRVMVEGGPTVAASLVKADLVDEAVLLRSDKPIGADGIDPLADTPFRMLTHSVNLAMCGSEQLGPDRIEYFERP